MTIEEIEARKAEIAVEMEKDDADLDALTEEVRSLNEQAKGIKDKAEKRTALRAAVSSGKGEVITDFRSKEKSEVEIRNSKEYIEAYAEGVKSGDYTECRALMTTNASSDGTVAIPDFVYDIVRTSWDKNDIMSLVRKVSLGGNIKVNFEISANDAVKHLEGGEPVTEEELTLGIVTIIPEYFRKWKGISKQAYSLRGEAFLRYIYDEIYTKIVKAAADETIAKIVGLNTSATGTAVSAAKITAAPDLETVAKAFANLSDDASNPVIVMNKKTWANFEAARAKGHYAYDPYMGLPVHFSSKLPAYDDAGSGEVYMTVGDFGEGVLCNLPNGDNVEFTFDQFTQKKSGIIEIFGEQYIGIGIISDHAFTNVAKA